MPLTPDPTQAQLDALLATTPLGRAVLAERAAKAAPPATPAASGAQHFWGHTLRCDPLDTLLAMTPLGRAALAEQASPNTAAATPTTPTTPVAFADPVAFAATLAVPPLTPAQRKVLASVLTALAAPSHGEEGMAVPTLSHLLKLSQPETVALVQQMARDKTLEFRAGRVYAHRATVAARY